MEKIEIPVKTVSVLNTREHWSKRARRTKTHRHAAFILMKNALQGRPIELPARIQLTRLGRKKMDDDNLAAALKAVRDGIADAIGIDDGDKRVAYCYAQKSSRKYAVEVAFKKSPPPAL